MRLHLKDGTFIDEEVAQRPGGEQRLQEYRRDGFIPCPGKAGNITWGKIPYHMLVRVSFHHSDTAECECCGLTGYVPAKTLETDK